MADAATEAIIEECKRWRAGAVWYRLIRVGSPCFLRDYGRGHCNRSFALNVCSQGLMQSSASHFVDMAMLKWSPADELG